MKTAMSALDLHFMIQELSLLADAKLMKIFEHDKDKGAFCFQFHKSGGGKFLLNILLSDVVYICEQKFEFPQTPPGFCAFLRKYLKNARLKEIRQIGFERIFEMVFSVFDTTYILVVELFSSGNMILCQEDYKIKGLLYTQNWQSRTVRGGVIYEFPPAQYNIFNLNEDLLSSLLKSTQKDTLVTFLAVDLSLGGFYSEYVLSSLKIDKNSHPHTFTLTHELFSAITHLLTSPILAEIKDKEICPIGGISGEKYESFSLAIDSVFSSKFALETFQNQKEEAKKEVSRVQKVLTLQQQKINGFENEIEINTKKGDLIYEHYSEISEVLLLVEQLRKKLSWTQIKEELSSYTFIDSIDEHTGEITFCFD